MFNSYSNSNHFSYNINAVSGTLRKSHPKSRIIVIEIKETLRIFDKEKPAIWIKDFDTRPIVVLQVMLCNNNMALVEFVEQEDFELVGDNNEDICR